MVHCADSGRGHGDQRGQYPSRSERGDCWPFRNTDHPLDAGHKKGGDTREEEGATAKSRRPREEEGPSDPNSLSRGMPLYTRRTGSWIDSIQGPRVRAPRATAIRLMSACTFGSAGPGRLRPTSRHRSRRAVRRVRFVKKPYSYPLRGLLMLLGRR